MSAKQLLVAACGLAVLAGCGSSATTKTVSPSSAPSTSGSPIGGPANSAGSSTTSLGSPSSKAPADGAVVVCSIVKKADVQAVFGGTVAEGVAGKTASYCDFDITGTLKSGKAVDALGATVGVFWNAMPLDPNSKVLNAAATKVPELGVAFYQSSGNALFVAYHGGTLTYQSHGPDDDSVEQANLIQLAKATYQR